MKASEAFQATCLNQYNVVKNFIKMYLDEGHTATEISTKSIKEISGMIFESVAEMLATDGFDVIQISGPGKKDSFSIIQWKNAADGKQGKVISAMLNENGTIEKVDADDKVIEQKADEVTDYVEDSKNEVETVTDISCVETVPVEEIEETVAVSDSEAEDSKSDSSSESSLDASTVVEDYDPMDTLLEQLNEVNNTATTKKGGFFSKFSRTNK